MSPSGWPSRDGFPISEATSPVTDATSPISDATTPIGDATNHTGVRLLSFADDLDAQRAQIMRAVRQASTEWAEAMRAHKQAPPDRGFATRLKVLGQAAEREQVAWEHAHAAGLLWRPIPDAGSAEPPYELRPGTGRRGPAELWTRFDAAVAGLNQAIGGSSAAAVADAFGEIAEVSRLLSEALADEDGAGDGSAPRARGAA